MKTRGRVIAATVVTWVIVTAIAAFHLLDTLELPARDRALSLLRGTGR